MLERAIILSMPAPKKRQRVQSIKLSFDPPLLAWLRLEAKRLDVSISEIVRRAVFKTMESK